VVVGNYSLSDQLVFGGIGIGGRGMSDLRQLLGDSRVRFAAIADIRESAREMVKSTVDNYYRNHDCVMYRDATELLARKDIDALLIATSDRWHGPMAMWAAQSGKDMYIEKPAAMSIMESYALADNVRRYGVVYQSGCQRKNQYAFEFAVGLARSGKLGRLLAVHADTAIGLGAVDEGGHGWWAAESPEPDPLVFDWDKWLGPCLWRPYNSAYADRGRRRVLGFPRRSAQWASHDRRHGSMGRRHGYTVVSMPKAAFPGRRADPAGTRSPASTPMGKAILRNHGWNLLGSCSNRFEELKAGWRPATADDRSVSQSEVSGAHAQGTRCDPTAEHIRTSSCSASRSRTPPRANADVTARPTLPPTRPGSAPTESQDDLGSAKRDVPQR
jgi:hypothetical protein